MNKALVMYFSKYGTTKEYAKWIAEELDGDLVSIKDIQQNRLENYGIIILGSGLYAGEVKGIDIIVRNFEKLKDKKIIIFTCGLADYSKEENMHNIYTRINKIIPDNIIKKIKIFYLRGGINYKELSIKHKIMMNMLKIMIERKSKDKLNEETKDFIGTFGKEINFMSKENVSEIIEYCKNG